MDEKIDPYKHKERYFNWKEKVKDGIPDISKENSNIILQYLSDMEIGLNTSNDSPRGPRSFIRLNTLRDKMIFFAKNFDSIYKCKIITDVTEEQLGLFFSKMANGEMLKKDGKRYLGTPHFVKIFKAFWHWYQKTNRKKGNDNIKDITLDLDTRQDKPAWVYLSEEQIKQLCENVKFDYKVLIMFLLDTGIRAPTELMNVKVSDLHEDYKKLDIREETSKTFGRKINLMLCSDLLKNYIEQNNLKKDDNIFTKSPFKVNEYLKRVSTKVFGDGKSLAGEKYSNLTLYDFRHNACCYWIKRYKDEMSLMYRFGWKKSDKIHYYSEMLGMQDTITKEDLLTNNSKTELEREMNETKRENKILQDKVVLMESQMKQILELVNSLKEKA